MPTIEDARSWYPQTDPIHGIEHILRVYRLAERIAIEEGADLRIVRASVLLHDAQDPDSENEEPSQINPANRSAHHHHSARFAGDILRAEGWGEADIAAVQHCIRAHRYRDDTEKPETLEAEVLFDADKLDAIGAIGVARAIAYAARAGQPIYSQPSEHFLQTGETIPSEPHSAYHEYLFKLRLLKSRMFTPSGRDLAEERHRFMAEFFERLESEIYGRH